jgi:branched-chain amino acid transport system substrate-binding protein
MKLTLKTWLATSLAGAAVLLAGMLPAAAQESIKFALCYDISKAYSFVTPQVAQAARDYATLLNQKGGISGHPIEVIVEDHGNEPQRGIECYEKLKREGVMVFDFLSTPVSRAVLPRISKDGNIMLQSLAGRGDAVDGEVFKWVFPVGPTYWGQAANDVAYIKQKQGGNLKGVKIAFFYIDYPFGQEPIGILKTLAAKEGFDLQLFPYPLPGNDQASAWTQMRRFDPDWIISWSLSNMHVMASREMKRNGIPMSKYISVNWLNEVDIKNIGADAAKGLKRGTNVAGGQDHPLIKEIITELYDKGKGAGDRKHLEDVYYNTGLAIYSIAFEGARLAVEKGGWPLTPEKLKVGLESIKDFSANGLMAPLTVTAADHGGGGKTRIEMWDGTKWVQETDWIAGFPDDVWSVVKASSAEYAKSEAAK